MENRQSQTSITSKTTAENEFSIKISRLSKSRAYLDYCEEVYGYRIYLFNMMDKAQIDFLLNSIIITKDDTIVDLGCGAGSILNLLTLKYGCSSIGIDMINNEVTEQNAKAITYINGDIDKISEYNIAPTITLSVDSFYFSRDLNKLLHQLAKFKDNKMYIFYSQYLFDETVEDKNTLNAESTKLAVALKNNGLRFTAIDYSENERILYFNSLRSLKKLEKAFADEGNTDLFEQKLKEDMLGMELYNKGFASRYLYIIDKAKDVTL